MAQKRADADLVNAALERKGLTIAELADAVGDKSGQLYHWLGKRRRKTVRAPLPLRLKTIDALKLPASPVLDEEEISLMRMACRAIDRERRGRSANGLQATAA